MCVSLLIYFNPSLSVFIVTCVEFAYNDLFRVWECVWSARWTVSHYLEEFISLAIMKQYSQAIMDAHLDPSDILNLFTGV